MNYIIIKDNNITMYDDLKEIIKLLLIEADDKNLIQCLPASNVLSRFQCSTLEMVVSCYALDYYLEGSISYSTVLNFTVLHNELISQFTQ